MKHLVIHLRRSAVIQNVPDDDPRIGPWFSYIAVFDTRSEAEAFRDEHLRKIAAGEIL